MAQPSLPVHAFANRQPPDEFELKYKQPKSRGPQPTDLGIRPGGVLKPCVDGRPHCLSSTPDPILGDEERADWLVEPFKYDKPLADALADVKATIAAYPSGQRGVDGGGFEIMKEGTTATMAYVYVQFEARRKGYIDDFEIALSDGIASVRTSSRIGYLDIGVNGKRYQWFAETLGRLPSWTTTPLRSVDHPEYFAQNSLTDQALAAGKP